MTITRCPTFALLLGQPGITAEERVVEIESEQTARNRELKCPAALWPRLACKRRMRTSGTEAGSN